jgi:ribonuclease BN (tRNA processing enzyme)
MQIKVVFLGTNGWYDTKTGNTLCVLIESAKEYVILDAGNGLYKIDRYVTKNKPIYLFLSHFHLDHIIGLHILAKFSFKQGITLCVPPGGSKFIKGFISSPLTAAPEELKYKIQIVEVTEGRFPGPFLERYLLLRHKEPCFGMRFKFGKRIIAFLPDTGICDNAFTLSKEADLLIAESAFRPGHDSDEWPHLNPESGAEIAKQAHAKKLALVHFDAAEYPTMKERKEADKSAKKIFKNAFATIDDQVVYI